MTDDVRQFVNTEGPNEKITPPKEESDPAPISSLQRRDSVARRIVTGSSTRSF